LHSRCCAGVAVANCAVDYIKGYLPFIQPHLKVCLQSSISEIDSAPLDVENAIGRAARH
jgi:hypothetical protein